MPPRPVGEGHLTRGSEPSGGATDPPAEPPPLRRPWSRWFTLACAAYAAVAFVAFLGPGLQLPQWVLDVAPTTHVGNPPLDAVSVSGLIGLGALATVLAVVGLLGFRRRDIPQA